MKQQQLMDDMMTGAGSNLGLAGLGCECLKVGGGSHGAQALRSFGLPGVVTARHGERCEHTLQTNPFETKMLRIRVFGRSSTSVSLACPPSP